MDEGTASQPCEIAGSAEDVLNYSQFFQSATGHPPYPYQQRLAEDWPEVLRVPTGAGKTAAVILSWLYSREHRKSGATRLVFCLPMRVLVKQTVDNARGWVKKLGLSERYKVYELMGGVLEEEWELAPAEPAILVGTQDMLLSRALNRGYAMSRYRWSVPFGLLHNDAQWVFDEVQIMGVARATSVQLQAFREREQVYGSTRTLWMSATLEPDWLATVDRSAPSTLQELSAADLSYSSLARRMNAPKSLQKAPFELNKETKKDYSKRVAEFALGHHSADSLSLIIVNQVDRAVEVYRALQKHLKGKPEAPALLLLHSRFRPPERAAKEAALTELQKNPGSGGAVIVSTQVVEAGVDLSARLLISELCPFSSMVQRLGRCNRDGQEPEGGLAFWIDLKDALLPYDQEQLEACASIIHTIPDASPACLRQINGFGDESDSDVVLRHKDLRELFETTSDLAGEDIDISRYIREPNTRDAQVFWRRCDEGWTNTEGLPLREELCNVPLSDLRTFLGGDRQAFRWNYGEELWETVDRNRLKAGQLYLLKASSGGYDCDLGFGKEYKGNVQPVAKPDRAKGYDSDRLGGYDLTLEEHTLNVHREMQALLASLQSLELPNDSLLLACLWHDYGKAHDVFQGTMYRLPAGDLKPLPLLGKSKMGGKHYRKGFRHEFASALAALQTGVNPLVVFLVAVHHGKIRFSVRPIPQEQLQVEHSKGHTIRGVKTGDQLPAVTWGGLSIAETTLDLEVLGLGHRLSWVRTLYGLVENPDYGVFRLGFLESLIRSADVRASKAESQQKQVVAV